MMSVQDRRQMAGIAVVTVRTGQKLRYQDAGLACQMLSLQDTGPLSNPWPLHRPPIVLDTIGLPIHDLVRCLVWSSHPVQRHPGSIVLADPADVLRLRLIALCPTVAMIGGDDPELLSRWLPHLGRMPLRREMALPIWLMPPPHHLPLDPLLLRVLMVLPTVSNWSRAAALCDVSASTLSRCLRRTRVVLALPEGRGTRWTPDAFARLVFNRLATVNPDYPDEQ